MNMTDLVNPYRPINSSQTYKYTQTHTHTHRHTQRDGENAQLYAQMAPRGGILWHKCASPPIFSETNKRWNLRAFPEKITAYWLQSPMNHTFLTGSNFSQFCFFLSLQRLDRRAPGACSTPLPCGPVFDAGWSPAGPGPLPQWRAQQGWHGRPRHLSKAPKSRLVWILSLRFCFFLIQWITCELRNCLLNHYCFMKETIHAHWGSCTLIKCIYCQWIALGRSTMSNCF